MAPRKPDALTPYRLPRVPRLPGQGFAVRTRGPRALQGALFATGAKPWAATFAAVAQQYPAITEPEAAIYWAHLQLKLVPGVDFDYQANEAGGRKLFGGIVLDFIEYDVPVAIPIQGVYWHYERGEAQLWRDAQVDVLVAKFGYIAVPIDADDALGDPVFYLTEARLGRDHSRAGPGHF